MTTLDAVRRCEDLLRLWTEAQMATESPIEEIAKALRSSRSLRPPMDDHGQGSAGARAADISPVRLRRARNQCVQDVVEAARRQKLAILPRADVAWLAQPVRGSGPAYHLYRVRRPR